MRDEAAAIATAFYCNVIYGSLYASAPWLESE